MISIGESQLKQLQQKYGSDRAIADLYGVSRQTIFLLRKKYSIPALANKFDIRNRRIVSLYKNGVAPMKIALEFGVSLTQIYRIISPSGSSIGKIDRNYPVYERAYLQLLLQKLPMNQKVMIISTPIKNIDLETIEMLYQKKKGFSKLVVLIICDDDIEKKESIFELDSRAKIVSALKPVDYVAIVTRDGAETFSW